MPPSIAVRELEVNIFMMRIIKIDATFSLC